MLKQLLLLVLAVVTVHAQLAPNGATASFKGSLPPKPTAALSAEQEAGIEARLKTLTGEFQTVKTHERAADADIFLKAVRYALEFDEWYDKKAEDGVKKANALLDEAEKRIASLKKNEAPWMEGSGQKVLGFYSKIDDSPQPYGVEIPEGLDYKAKLTPMWIWLHGRGDTATDLHFVYSRLTAKKPGQFQPAGTIVIHPFGRYCNGWKSAGETDVFECRDDAMKRFNIDGDRIALAGFSMGGAGAWHLGAHYAAQWVCVHTGAGFADVKRYQKLTPDKYPVWYEQKLWGMYDVPDYARNFYNVPLISYSGEIDAQRDSAEYMMEVLAKEGLKPPHLIGPGMGHKYHPEVIKEVQAWIEKAVAKGREPYPDKVSLQTRSGRYIYQRWLRLNAVDELWEDARIDAEMTGAKTIRVTTVGVKSFELVFYQKPNLAGYKVFIDDQEVQLPEKQGTIANFTKVWRDDGVAFTWHLDEGGKLLYGDRPYDSIKEAGSCMDDVFFDRFIFVLPDGPCEQPAVDAWVKEESQHAIRRWRSLMRGDPIVMTASEYLRHSKEVHEEDQSCHLVLWGDAKSNPLIATLLKHKKTPLQWDSKQVKIGKQSFDAATHVPLMVLPNKAIERVRLVDDGKGKEWTETAAIGLVLLNSGLTFREAHDRTNSLQNPKLPDWAILDITQPPNAESAGKVVAADFFDDRWQVKPAASH